MPSLFNSVTDLYLSFPSLHLVELHSKKDGEGSVEYTATSTPGPLPAGTLHSLEIAHKLSPASYRVTETLVGGDNTYTVSALGPKFAGFATTMETAGLLHGKHLFQGPDNVHYNWSGKGDKLELLVPSDGNKEIAEFTPDDRKIELKASRFGSHKDLDSEFVIASFFALLLFQDEHNKVHHEQDVLGRARGRTWKERAEQAARPQAAAAASNLSGAAAYVSNLTSGLSKTLSAKAAEFQEKK